MHLATCLARACVVFHLTTATASAGYLVEIRGDIGDGFQIGGSTRQVEMMSWRQDSTVSQVEITARVGSIDGNSRSIRADLTDASGPSAGGPIATATVTVASFSSIGDITPTTLFSGLTLRAGQYFLTLFNEDTASDVDIRWARGSTVVFAGGVSANGEIFANTDGYGSPDVSQPWKSILITSPYYDNAYTVTGTPAVPEPSGLVLWGIAAAVLIARGRRLRMARLGSGAAESCSVRLSRDGIDH